MEGRRPEDPTADRSKQDITEILRAWEYDESNALRRVRTQDGREVIQVRLPLGIEQYEIDGRPDGRRPEGRESWLEYYLEKARAAEREAPVSGRASPRAGRGFSLSEEDFIRLHEEGILYYHRYLLFFRMQEYALCARDTRRNLKLANFVSRHADPGLAEDLVQYRPYIIRMHFTSRALLEIQTGGDLRRAIRALRAGKRCVDRLPLMPGNDVFALERERALASLRDLVRQLRDQIPPSPKVQLRRLLRAAVLEEDYERAAALRDEIARLEGRDPEDPAEGGSGPP